MLFQQASREMADEYERISARSKEDPGTAGDEGEENWAELLRRWLPADLHVVTKGRIISSNGEASRQLDVLVLNSSYPKGLLNKKLYLAAGVLACFECKITLLPRHIRKAVRTGMAIGNLARGDSSVRHRISYGLLAHSHSIKGDKPAESVIGEALIKADLDEIQNPGDMLDFLCVANLGTWLALMNYMDLNMTGKVTLTTGYVGPFPEPFRQILTGGDSNSRYVANPIGRLLTALLTQLGRNDREIAAIARYFDNVGLVGSGQGSARSWPYTMEEYGPPPK
jgi:hypothetical protein